MTESRDQRVENKQPVEWETFDENDVDLEGTPVARDGRAPRDKPATGPDIRPAQFVPLQDEPGQHSNLGIDLLRDVEVELTAELGSARMQIKHVLGLHPGSVLELNRLAGEPVDVLINKTLIARGEVVVVDEKFAIRIIEIVPPDHRLPGS